MQDLDELCEMTVDILDILTSKELTNSEKIEELVCMGYDYEDILRLALLVDEAIAK
jgi:hypothetical protein